MIYRRFRPELQNYAALLQTGKVHTDASGEFGLPPLLIKYGAQQTKHESGDYVITFGTMPDDAVPELWYCPNGMGAMPAGMQERKRHKYFHFTKLDANWAECEWDD